MSEQKQVSFLVKATRWFAKFILGHGSSIVFTIFLISWMEGMSTNLWGYSPWTISVPENWFSSNDRFDYLFVFGTTIVYLWLQGIAAAWGKIGSDDGYIADLIFSFFPAGAILWHISKGVENWDYVIVIMSIVIYDLVVNTKILAKVARLTSELAQAKS